MGVTLPAVIDLVAYHGDTWSQMFRLKHDTVPVDLTGATVASWAKRLNGSIVPLAVTVTNPTGGELRLSAGSAGLPTDTYTYDVEVIKAAVVTTWIRGALLVTEDVTNATAVR